MIKLSTACVKQPDMKYNTPTNSDKKPKKPKKSYSNLVTIYKNIGVLK
jgi:hypothetical protein